MPIAKILHKSSLEYLQPLTTFSRLGHNFKYTAFQMGFTLERKNLLLEEQILSFRNLLYLRREAEKGKQ